MASSDPTQISHFITCVACLQTIMATHTKANEDHKPAKKKSKSPRENVSRFELTVCYQCEDEGILGPEFVQSFSLDERPRFTLALHSVQLFPAYTAVSKMIGDELFIPSSGDKVTVRHAKPSTEVDKMEISRD